MQYVWRPLRGDCSVTLSLLWWWRLWLGCARGIVCASAHVHGSDVALSGNHRVCGTAKGVSQELEGVD